MGKREWKFIKYIYGCFLEVIYPTKSKCINCFKEVENQVLCNSCLQGINLIKKKECLMEYPLYICGYYSYTLKELIFKLKYKRDFHSGDYLVNLIYEKIKENNLNFDYIVYVPTSKRKLKEKGFNQCEFLAKKLEKKTDVKAIDLLVKKSNIKEQKLLSSQERRRNMVNAFDINENFKLDGKSLLLIDDVITTGSTLESCINCINKRFNVRINLLTIAKSNI